MKIKVCGMRENANVRDVAQLHPDFMGFIFHERSPRNAIGIETEIVTSLPDEISPVAVTVNKPQAFLLSLASTYGFRIFQLHGKESPELCDSLRRQELTVWKALQADENLEAAIQIYKDSVDMLLLDTPTPAAGGSGKKFDWNILCQVPDNISFMLSGGISAEDAAEIKNLSHPSLKGVDINSRFEISPGLKDTLLLTQFFNELR